MNSTFQIIWVIYGFENDNWVVSSLEFEIKS